MLRHQQVSACELFNGLSLIWTFKTAGSLVYCCWLHGTKLYASPGPCGEACLWGSYTILGRRTSFYGIWVYIFFFISSVLIVEQAMENYVILTKLLQRVSHLKIKMQFSFIACDTSTDKNIFQNLFYKVFLYFNLKTRFN